MLSRRTLFKVLAAICLGTVLPAGGYGTAATQQTNRKTRRLNQAVEAANMPTHDSTGFAGSLQAIEQWEDLMDDLDCMELAAQYTSLGKIESKSSRGIRECRRGLCPFSQEGDHTFTVYHPDYRCDAGCNGSGGSGTTIEFYARMEGITPVEAMKRLKDMLDSGTLRGFRPRHEALWGIMAEASRFYNYLLCETPEGAPGREWLEREGITRQAIKRLRLGFAPYSDESWDQLASHLRSKGYSFEELEAVGLCVSWAKRISGSLHKNSILIPVQTERGDCWGFLEQSIEGFGEGLCLDGMSEISPYRYGRLVFPAPVWPSDYLRYPFVVLTGSPWEVVVLREAGIREAFHAGECPWPSAGRRQQTLSALAPRIVYPCHAEEIGGYLFHESLRKLGACLDKLELLVLPDGQSMSDLLRAEGIDALRARLSQTVSVKSLFSV